MDLKTHGKQHLHCRLAEAAIEVQLQCDIYMGRTEGSNRKHSSHCWGAFSKQNSLQLLTVTSPTAEPGEMTGNQKLQQHAGNCRKFYTTLQRQQKELSDSPGEYLQVSNIESLNCLIWRK